MGVSEASFRSSGTSSLHFWSFGGVRGFFLATLELHFGCHGVSWAPRGRPWGSLGAQRAALGRPFGALEASSAPFSELWRCPGLHFGVSWAPFWVLWRLLGALGGALGLTWGPHGVPWPPKGSQRHHFWFILVAFWMHCKFILNVKIDSKSDPIFK